MDLILYLINLCFYLYFILIIVRIVLPFIKHSPNHPAVRLIFILTEPFLLKIRQALPPRWMGGVDFSAFILIILLFLLQRVVLFFLGSM